MPARRRNRQTIKKPMPKRTKMFVGICMAIVALFVFVFVLLTSRAIEGTKFSVVHSNPNGEALVKIYDFELKEVTVVKVPAETYLSSAYGFGDWRVESLPKLGSQEGYGDELLRLSLVKNFHFPIDAEEGSLSIREKLQIWWFSFRTPEQNWYEINLADTSYLKESQLPDGEEGYVVGKERPSQVSTIFAIANDDSIMRIGIYDHTGGARDTISNLSGLVHILGGDWAVIEKSKQDMDCLLRGENKLILKRISRVLVCEIDNNKVEGNFDIEIVVGEKFKERF